MSGIGKGVGTASIGRILKSKGFKVEAVKIDPYLNVDAGTMNPVEHGEVFVTDDGIECDQDVGNYERFLEQNATSDNYITTGRVYRAVIQRERNLEYDGRCVQVARDIPDEALDRLKKLANKTKADFILVEIGGTVGDYENILFLEAARKLKLKNPKDVFFILVSYLPVPHNIGEMKTKPTQHAVKWLNMTGIQPNLIIARAPQPLDGPRREKISIFCNVEKEDVISAPDIDSIYEVPLNFEKENMSNRILERFELKPRKADLKEWGKAVERTKNPDKEVKIGIVGKYFKTGDFTLMDSYISVIEAVKHSSYFFKAKPEIVWLDAEKYEKNAAHLKELNNFGGVIVPGGFGKRGAEGKIKAIQYLRENKIPFLGLCLGLQMAVIEFARNACGLSGANSTEFEPNCQVKIIDMMLEQKKLIASKKYGGTMRLGAYSCRLKKGTVAFKAYRKEMISERHRHRYEVNNKYRKTLEEKGMVMSGVNPDRDLVEIIELPSTSSGQSHPFFLGTQFHPEFKSSPLEPHPLFREFIRACLGKVKSG